MKSLRRSILCGLLVASLGVAYASTNYPPYVKKTLYATTDLRGKPAPKLKVQQWLTGAAPNTKGKTLIVDFWATWCPPCRELIPEMNSWKQKFGDRVAVIGISDEDASTVQDFMKKTPMQYNVAIDKDHTMSKTLGVQGIPHVMVVTPDGIVRWQGFPLDSADKLTSEKIEDILDAYKAQHAK